MRHVLEHDLNIRNVSEKSRQCILATLLAHKKRQQTCINTFYVCQGLFSYRHHIGKREDPGETIRLKKKLNALSCVSRFTELGHCML